MSFFALELKFPKGSVIFREGENSDCFFVVKSGKVKITVPDK
jgi:CRP-like cAMP-binding protein